MSIDFSPHAELDVENAVDELTDGYGPALALAFRARLTATVNKIAAMPLAFSLVEPPPPNYPGLHVLPITRFTARLIVYTPTDTGILIVRILRAACDWHATLQ